MIMEYREWNNEKEDTCTVVHVLYMYSSTNSVVGASAKISYIVCR